MIEAEKIWSKADGFKGPHSFKGEHGLLEAEIEGDPNKDLDIYFEENEKAYLYYYESDKFGSEKHYSILTGHKKRPEGSDIRNLRQGEFDLSTFSFKIGFRFKF